MKQVINWLKQKNKGITLLQETHTLKSDEKKLEKGVGR